MAEKEIWIGSHGPLLYDDTDQYPDGANFRGFRAAQFYADSAPTTSNEVLRQGDLYGGGLKVGFTTEGGLFITLTNRTGSASVKGSIVSASTTYENAFSLTGLAAYKAIGVVYDAGIADGSECRVVIAGIAEVLLEDGTAATKGHWVKTSATTGGRADATNMSEPGATLAELQEHSQEIGHCIDDATAGTDVLAKIVMHFN